MKAVADIKQAIITIMEKLVLKSLSLLHGSLNPPTLSKATVAGANFPDGNICLSFAAGKKTPGRLTALESSGAQTQHVQKGYHLETQSNSSVSKIFLIFFFNDHSVGLLHTEKCYVRKKRA